MALPSAAVPEVNFRFATDADVHAIVDLVQSAYRGERSREGWTTEADFIEGQRTDAGMVGETIARSDAWILLAEGSFDGSTRLIGCAELSSYSGTGGGGYFGMFTVDPRLQSRGYGGSILDEAERLHRDEFGHDRLVLFVLSLRPELIDLYSRRGFVPTGETQRFPYGNERYGRPNRDDLEVLAMAKDLR